MDKYSIFMAIMSTIIPLVILIVPKGKMINTLEKGLEGSSNVVQNYMPYINTQKAFELIDERKNMVLTIISSLSVLITVAAIPFRLLYADRIVLNLYVTAVVVVMLVINYILDLVLAFRVSRMFESKWGTILFILPPISFAITSPAISNYLTTNSNDINGVFDDGDD